MSSTNKTTNYELSQFLGTDKPAWLADYNSDMAKIDAQMKLNADGVTTASGASTTNATNIGTLANLTTTAKTDLVSAINEVDSNADTAQNTATSANTTAGQAKLKVDALADYFKLTGKQNITVTTNQGVIDTGSSKISSAYNTDGSLGKIYGKINLSFSGAPSGTVTITIADTSLRPTEAITINGLVQVHVYASGSYNYGGTENIVINTNGTATITVTPTSIVNQYSFIIPPCLLFMSNFGDE